MSGRWWAPMTRLVALLTFVAATGAMAQSTQTDEPARVGYVGPVRSGNSSVPAAVYDIVGEAARNGALLAWDDVETWARSTGAHLELFQASAPSPEAARRAAERLVLVEGVQVLIGGLGAGQAAVLADVAQRHDVLFVNVGSSDLLVRSTCDPRTFHVEASAGMYLDAMVARSAAAGDRSWFLVHLDDEEGWARAERMRSAVDRHGRGGSLVGTSAVPENHPLYRDQLIAAREAGADALVLALGAVDQIAFLAQQSSLDAALPVIPYPDPLTQAREYMAAAVRLAGDTAIVERVALWEATLQEDGADDLNERFASRYANPMDPYGWAAYAAVVIVYQAHLETGSADPATLAAYLRAPETTFDLHKGMPLSFRSWDGQLRQPLYGVALDPDAPWNMNVSSRIGVGYLLGRVPLGASDGVDPMVWLDTLGDGPPSEGACR